MNGDRPRALGNARGLWTLVALLALAFAVLYGYDRLTRTGEPPPRRPAPEEVVVQVGPFDVTAAELDEFLPYVRRFDPALARGYVRRVMLSDYILPKKVVRSLVPASELNRVRARAERLAHAVMNAGGDVAALRSYGKPYGVRDDGVYYPPLNSLTIDVARAVFTVPVGAVTEAIDSVSGSVIAGVVDERKTATGTPTRRIVAVFFAYGGDRLLQSQIREEVEKLRAQHAWVHPYYRDQLGSFFAGLLEEPLRETRGTR